MAYLGIDMGTSYCKVTVLDGTGSVLCEARQPSPRATVRQDIDAGEAMYLLRDWWRTVTGLVAGLPVDRRLVDGICVTGISPVVCFFDRSDPDIGLGVPYGRPRRFCEGHLLNDRLAAMRKAGVLAELRSPCVADLVAYVSHRLGGALSVDPVCRSSLGAPEDVDPRARWSLEALEVSGPGIGTPVGFLTEASSRMLGLRRDCRVVQGGPDNFGTIVGAGLRNCGDVLIYLGTFGSSLRLTRDLEAIFAARSFEQPPYAWMMATPGFGLAIEQFAKGLTAGDQAEAAFEALNGLAVQAPAGAQGVVWLMPRFFGSAESRGVYEFVGDGAPSTPRNRARAVLESIGYAAAPFLEGSVPGGIGCVPVAGGGARSRLWPGVIADVLGLPTGARSGAADALGPALIAARADRAEPKPTMSLYEPALVDRDQIRHNQMLYDNYVRSLDHRHNQDESARSGRDG